METAIWQTLITQAPGTAAVIFVVVLFLKAIKERDIIFIEQMRSLTEEIKEVKEIVLAHDTKVSAGMDEMRREALKRHRSRVAKATGD